MNASVVVSSETEAEGAAKRSGSAEYSCVTRLRHRRLLAFLYDQRYHGTFNALVHETDAFMSLGHLRGLVKQGLWGDAIEYLDTYLPPTRPRSLRAQVLHNFLATHQRFANAVAGNKDTFLPKFYIDIDHSRIVSHAEFRLRSITTSILGLDHIRAGLDWERVRTQASFAIYRLAQIVPELRGYMSLPTACIMPHHVLPIASGLCRRRRHVKKKQQRSRRRTKAIIRALKSHRFEDSRAGSLDEAKELLADYLNDTLIAGGLKGSYLIDQPGWKPGAPSWQTTLPYPAKNSGISSGTNAGARGAPVCQPMSGTLTDAKTSGTSSLTNRKNSRDEPATVEEDRDPKRQWTTGALGEASLVSVVEIGERVRSPARPLVLW